MTKDIKNISNINNKIVSIQKDFYELNNLFELSIIANQSTNMNDFMINIAEFIKLSLNVENVNFFFKEGDTYTIVNNNVFIEILESDEVIWKLLQKKDLIALKNEKGDSLFKTFVETNSLQKIDSSYLRGFSKNKELFCICSLGLGKNGELLSTAELAYLNKIFNYIEPILYKFLTQDKQQLELQQIYKTLHNVSVLYNISQAVNFIDDLKRLLNVILNKALETIDAEKGSLMLYDIAENILQVKVVYGLADKKVEDDINSGIIECAKMRAGEGIAGTVFSNKKSIISNLGQNDPRFKDMGSVNNINSLLCVPLIAKGEAIGVINITNKRDNKLFSKQDLEFVEALANQAAIAIDNAKLYELATKDGLTKLYTHRHFQTLLEAEIKRAARYSHNLSIVMVDIDNFKSINDTYGHPVGDQILREISAVISKTIRKIDMGARYGGEEFTVILPETKGDGASIIAHRLRDKISKIQVQLKDGTIVHTTASFGISSFPTGGETEKEMVETADIALYMSKNSGKNCVHLYTQEGCIKTEFEE